MDPKNYIISSSFPKMILGAHQDDVELSCTGLIIRTIKDNSLVSIIYATNGAPFDKRYYPRFDISNSEDYATLRKKESLEALSRMGVNEMNIKFLSIPDQKLFENIDEVSDAVAILIQEQKPLLLFSPAYEGGHPDHDALRFIANIAVKKSRHKPILCEYPEYNYFNGIKNYFKFILDWEEPVKLYLTSEESESKAKILRSFPSQQKYITSLLESDIMQNESFRIAPEINFSEFPHRRPLFYEDVNVKTTPEEVMNAFNKFLNNKR